MTKENILNLVKKKYNQLTLKKLLINRYNVPILNYLLIYLSILLSRGPIQMVSNLTISTILNWLLFLFPFSIIFSLWKSNKHKWIMTLKIFLIMLVSLSIIPLFFIATFFSGVVARVDTNLFINKFNPDVKIEFLNFDIGATDNGAPGRIIKVNNFFPGLRYISDIDTNNLNKDEWERVK